MDHMTDKCFDICVMTHDRVHCLQQVQSWNLVCGGFTFENTADYASWTFELLLAH